MSSCEDDKVFLDVDDNSLEAKSDIDRLEHQVQNLINSIGSLLDEEASGLSPSLEAHLHRIKEALLELERKV